jgi:hypothetical protein
MKKKFGRPAELKDPTQMNLFVERTTKERLAELVLAEKSRNKSASNSRVITLLVNEAHARLLGQEETA